LYYVTAQAFVYRVVIAEKIGGWLLFQMVLCGAVRQQSSLVGTV